MDDDYLSDLYQKLSTLGEGSGSEEVTSGEISNPDPTYDQTVRDIYDQAHSHRNRLVDYYIKYTAGFTILILFLIFVQATVRIIGDNNFNIMDKWTLNILIGGMFVQFVVLLKIVTHNAWNFKSFFDHHNEMRNHKKQDPEEQL